ncbi:hypothetical protein WMY93_020207 [Mugilogobius chulae]|uniref:Uncharacterized protein n=1 Tax=Mugilogobius chulae TaxID=88201 RepID=A0AAW0NKQ1_9GOBI
MMMARGFGAVGVRRRGDKTMVLSYAEEQITRTKELTLTAASRKCICDMLVPDEPFCTLRTSWTCLRARTKAGPASCWCQSQDWTGLLLVPDNASCSCKHFQPSPLFGPITAPVPEVSQNCAANVERGSPNVPGL